MIGRNASPNCRTMRNSAVSALTGAATNGITAKAITAAEIKRCNGLDIISSIRMSSWPRVHGFGAGGPWPHLGRPVPRDGNDAGNIVTIVVVMKGKAKHAATDRVTDPRSLKMLVQHHHLLIAAPSLLAPATVPNPTNPPTLPPLPPPQN